MSTTQITTAKRIVIKIGSSLLVDPQSNTLHRKWLASLIQDVVEGWRNGQDIILVSSGAIPLGRRQLNLTRLDLQLEEKQAAAAVGQIKLAHVYQEMLAEHNITAAQILLTLDDSENRRRYINGKNTLETLLKLRAIPVINENDSIATAEIRFGDNDRLAARVAQMISADCLVLLSDIDGLYTANPLIYPEATFIPEVTALTSTILAMASDSTTEYGSGGMITKLAAAKIALASGCRMVIARGSHLHPLKHIDQTTQKTWFIPDTTPINARKNWLAQHLKPRAYLQIDEGAELALQQGKSLLAVGVLQIKGDFRKGDAIAIENSQQQEIARGISNYSASDVDKIKGQRSSAFEKILGYRGCEEIVHRDNLVFI